MFASDLVTAPIAMLICCITIFSYAYNKRRTEDSTHVLWNRIFFDLSSSYPMHLLPTPQKRIYVSPPSGVKKNIGGSGNSISTVTVANKVGVEVILDFCMLFPKVIKAREGRTRSHTGTLLESLQTLVGKHSEQQTINADMLTIMDRFEIDNMTIPLIAELKRPVSRRCCDILEYAQKLHVLLTAAQDQAMIQALCIFSNVQYGLQTNVMMIAASGEWWSFCLVRRSDRGITRFHPRNNLGVLVDPDTVASISVTLVDPEEVDDEGQPGDHVEEIQDPSQIDVDVRNTYVANLEQKIQRMSTLQRDRRNKKIEERNLDSRRNAPNQAGRAVQELYDFIEKANLFMVYHEKTLFELYTLWSTACRLLREEDMALGDDLEKPIPYFTSSHLSPEKINPASNGAWSPPMRLGSKVSQQYLAFIGENMNKEVKEYLQVFNQGRSDTTLVNKDYPGLEGTLVKATTKGNTPN